MLSLRPLSAQRALFALFAPLFGLFAGVTQAMHAKDALRVGLNATAAQPATALNEVYTQNILCRQNNCVNPLFPGLNDLVQLEQLVWQCSTHSAVSSYLDFCKGAIAYDPALPSPNSTTELVSNIVRSQEQAAATMFWYHLSGMGYDAWEHTSPRQSEDPCIQSVWNMVCYTYFPKADSACQSNEQSAYHRPCSGACSSYLSACQVECCDESPRCVFTHSYQDTQGQNLIQTGYHPDMGPSALCTGQANAARGLHIPALLLLGILGIHLSAGFTDGSSVSTADVPSRHVARPSARSRGWARSPIVIGACLVMCTLCLQGCDFNIPRHSVGNWRQNRDYLVQYEYVPPGQSAASAQLNSCAMEVTPALQCSGHGYCRGLTPQPDAVNPNTISFCYCDDGWADPECRTRRKSQLVTFLLSVFFGIFGADYFYLGYPLWGVAKLFTLGGLGFWWLLDIIRTGAGPIYAKNYRVTNDLPHWVFVLATVTLFMLCGFGVSLESYLSYRRKKRNDVLRLHEKEEAAMLKNREHAEGPRSEVSTRSVAGNRTFQGYGSMLPGALANAGAAEFTAPLA